MAVFNYTRKTYTQAVIDPHALVLPGVIKKLQQEGYVQINLEKERGAQGKWHIEATKFIKATASEAKEAQS